MITVSVSINGEPIFARTAVNRRKEIGKYVVDDGSFIEHNPDDGAIPLAIKMLECIKENPDKVIADSKQLQFPFMNEMETEDEQTTES